LNLSFLPDNFKNFWPCLFPFFHSFFHGSHNGIGLVISPMFAAFLSSTLRWKKLLQLIMVLLWTHFLSYVASSQHLEGLYTFHGIWPHIQYTAHLAWLYPKVSPHIHNNKWVRLLTRGQNCVELCLRWDKSEPEVSSCKHEGAGIKKICIILGVMEWIKFNNHLPVLHLWQCCRVLWLSLNHFCLFLQLESIL